jgi:hypothetical protein
MRRPQEVSSDFRWQEVPLSTGAPVSYSASRLRGKMVEIDLVSDPERLRELDLTVLDD